MVQDKNSEKRRGNIAVLMTCFNRKATTLRCLKTLFDQTCLMEITIDVFLVDDKSPDGTGDAVREHYPQVHVIPGTGDLYWGGGMRLAWDMAAAHADYDFYLWLNDDVELNEDAIIILLNDYYTVLEETGKEALISGCVCCPDTGKTTYSGHNGGRALEPNGTPQPVKHNNGNVVLVSRAIYQVVGNISKEFTQLMGDSDYGMRCWKMGFGSYVSSRHVGTCKPNLKPVWYDPDIPWKKRLVLLHSPTGMKPNERFIFYRRHYGLANAVLAVVKLYASALFPRLYFRLKKRLKIKGGLSID